MMKSKALNLSRKFQSYSESLFGIFRKKQLDVFSTVLSMREQRMKMVQKPQQYVYIFKCLRDEIRSQEADGEYYDL